MGREISYNALASHRRSAGLSAGRKSLLTPHNFPGSVEDVGPLPIAGVGLGEEKRGCERLWFEGGSPFSTSGNCLLSSGEARKRHNIPEGHICPWVLTMWISALWPFWSPTQARCVSPPPKGSPLYIPLPQPVTTLLPEAPIWSSRWLGPSSPAFAVRAASRRNKLSRAAKHWSVMAPVGRGAPLLFSGGDLCSL